MTERYLNYNKLMQEEFSQRVQKISIDAGFTCPNRDGIKGQGGCSYCNNQSFSPDFEKAAASVGEQIERGISFFSHKYKNQAYVAYFQSYTNTYGSNDDLKALYEEALAHPQVLGLVIGTRPDCVNDELLDYFEQLSKTHYLMIEYGIESTCDESLAFINRGHDYACSVETITKTAARGIRTAAHLILGLPNEDRETILSHAVKISELPLTAIKLHQLQLIKGTLMAHQYQKHPEWFRLYDVDEYVNLVVDFAEILNPKIAIERFVSQSPSELLIAPDWGVKNFEFVDKVRKCFIQRDSWQGKFYKD